jgi:transposase-like protein
MATRQRRKFTAEFPREVVKSTEQPGRSMTAVARELGVERSVLRR